MARLTKKAKFTIGWVFLCFFLVVILLFFFQPFDLVGGYVNETVVVTSELTVGNVYPEILNVSINNDADSVTLVPNSTTTVSCVAVIRDFNGEGDINISGKTIARFYDSAVSSYDDADDNNYHYSNNSCIFNETFGSYNGYNDDEYTLLANCTFDVWYYANNQTWICEIVSNDTYDYSDSDSDNITIDTLIAIGLPSTINYGTVNATFVSDENITNVTNFGNVKINLSLSGYAFEEGDGLAMNCTLGAIKNISIYYEKYNLTASNPGQLSLTEFENLYTNLTSNPVIKEFNLNYRQNDTVNKATNETYWRIYVPTGVAGTCQGNIVFAATQGG